MKKQIKQLSAGLFALLVCSAQEASAQQSYGLHDILELGLQNSHTMKINEAERAENEYAVKEAKMAYLPNLSVQGQGALLNSPDIRFMGQSSQMESPKNAAFVLGNLSVPVFNGFQLRNNVRMKQEIALAGMERESVDSTVVVVQLIDSYISLYKAQQSKKIIEQSIEAARKRVSDFEKMKENGLLSQNDFLKAQLQVSQLEMSLVDVQNKEALAQYNLNILAGLEPTTSFEADSSAIFALPGLARASTAEESMTSRRDYAALEHQYNASEYAIQLQRNKYYPHVNVSGMYVSMYVPNTLTIGNMVNLGLSVSFDISSLYKNPAAVAIREQQSKQLNEQLSQLEDKIRIEVQKGYLDYQTAQSKTALSEKITEQATENFRSVQEKFNNNLASTSDLLEAEVTLLQSQINEQLAQADAFLAWCNYLNVTGNLDQLRSIQ